MYFEVKAMLYKNYLFKRKKYISTFCEIVLPTSILILLVLIFSSLDLTFEIPASLGEASGFDFNKAVNQLADGSYQSVDDIAIIPNSVDMQQMGNQLQISFPSVQVHYFDAYIDLKTYLLSEGVENGTLPEIKLGVLFRSFGPDNYDYEILSRRNWGPVADRPPYDPTILEASGPPEAYHRGWWILQNWVETYIIETRTGSSFDPEVSIWTFPTKKFDFNIGGIIMGNEFMGIFLILLYIWPFTRFIRLIVTEKETRVKEGMKMMGMTDFAYWLSWGITYTIICGLTAILVATLIMLAFFRDSNWFLLWFFFFFFEMALMCLGVFFSSLFDKARFATLSSGFIIIFLFLPAFFITDILPRSTKAASCFSIPVALNMGLKQIGHAASFDGGLGFETWTKQYYGFSFMDVLLMLISDILIFFTLGWYIGMVWPGQYGIQHPLYFPFMPSFWLPMKGDFEKVKDKKLATGSRYEEVSSNLLDKRSIIVRGLTKIFNPNSTINKKIAVDNMNLDLFEDQIFCLLGHNGAGKTTALNVLTGLISATSGGASVFGYHTSSEMHRIRENLGVCPQHSILWDILSVKQHLEIFAGLKGIESETADRKIRQICSDVGILELIDRQAGNLSGGEKRKLSVAIALIGNSKVVFLDEPTSGMDPYSRRSTWNLLKEYRKGKCIILTTHFMDEADQLGDRIAIMHNGMVKCCGSPMYLKKLYGVGYSLTLSKKHGCDVNPIKKVVTDYVPEAEKTSEAALELSFRLPFTAAPKFPSLFKYLDNNLSTLHLENYGISVTTLEEVFLRVGHEADIESENNNVAPQLEYQQTRTKARKTDDLEQSKQDDPLIPKKFDNTPRFFRHFFVLFWKRLLDGIQSKRFIAFQLVLPIFLMTVVAIILKYTLFLDLPPRLMSPSMWNSELTPVLVPPVSFLPVNYQDYIQTDMQAIQWDDPLPAYVGHTYPGSDIIDGVTMSEWLSYTHYNGYGIRYGAYSFHPVTDDCCSEAAGCIFLYTNSTSTYSMPILRNSLSNTILKARLSSNTPNIRLWNRNLPFTSKQRAESLDTISVFTVITLILAFSFIPMNYISIVIQEVESRFKYQQFISGASHLAYWIANFVFDNIAYLITLGGVIASMYIFDIQQSFGDQWTYCLYIFFAAGPAFSAFSYLCHFIFKNHTSGMAFMLFIGIASVVASLILFFLQQIPFPKTYNRVRISKYFFRLLPPYCLGDAFLSLLIPWEPGLEIIRDFSNVVIDPYPQHQIDLIFLLSEAGGYFLITMIIEFIKSKPGLASMFWFKPKVPPAESFDADVVAEKQRVKNGSAEKTDGIIVNSLSKVFLLFPCSKKTAVRDVCYGVPRGECFGFLGVNGAGKTTCLECMLGIKLATSGCGRLLGYNTNTQQTSIRKRLGNCPQFDALLDTLTARQHIEMYCSLKMVHTSVMKEYVDYIVQKLDFEKIQHQKVGQYSGGMRRKLSLGLSLLSSPPLVFLDEPSTGLDPKSRRDMWNLISSTMATRSVILTTHSMEEAQALCDRIGIMCSGELRCIGSPQHLKTKYGNSYHIELQPNLLSEEKVTEYNNAIQMGQPPPFIRPTEKLKVFMNQYFPDSQLIEEVGELLKFRFPKKDWKLSNIFETIEAHRQEQNIAEYSVSEMSLEQIFLQFAAQDEANQGFRPNAQQLDYYLQPGSYPQATAPPQKGTVVPFNRQVQVQPLAQSVAPPSYTESNTTGGGTSEPGSGSDKLVSTSTPANKFCSACGQKNDLADVFCYNCGNKLKQI